MSIGDRDAGGTRRSYPIPPVPAREVVPLILCGVVDTVAPLALPRGRKGGSRSQRSGHSAKNRKWWIRWSQGGALAVSTEDDLGREYNTLPAPIIEPTCAAFGTNKIRPRAEKAGKPKRNPAVGDYTIPKKIYRAMRPVRRPDRALQRSGAACAQPYKFKHYLFAPPFS